MLIAAKTRTAGIIESVRVSFTIVAKSPAASLNAYPVATTLEVSFTAVPAQRPNAASESPRKLPSIGNTTTIIVSNRKVADIPYAISISVASITGAIAAIAEPPQIPVPALIRLLVFQFSPSSFPITAPSPKQVASVNTITTRENFPTVSTVVILRLAPRRIIANFSIFFDVNLIPGEVTSFGLKNALTIMPMNSAMTDAPIICIPAASSKCSSSFATAAIMSAKAMPGMNFSIFFMIPPNCFFQISIITHNSAKRNMI